MFEHLSTFAVFNFFFFFETTSLTHFCSFVLLSFFKFSFLLISNECF